MGSPEHEPYFCKTLEAIGNYATLCSRRQHYLNHDPETALRNIIRTCELALKEVTNDKSETAAAAAASVRSPLPPSAGSHND